MCFLLGVSRSGYYDWRKREESSRTSEDTLLKIEIQKVYDKSEGRYGSPRVWKALQNQGFCVSRKRIARLMQEMGLIARVTRVTYRAPGMRRFLASGENLRSDGAVPEAKNKVWVADVTYLKVKKLIFPRFNGHQHLTDEVSNASLLSHHKSAINSTADHGACYG
ncbi:IS3 family transposase [Thalassolituus oleivorans]|uniref:HTH-like domain-containing protein n=1 Tax=Thalassolituus oleivorans MIL-1 TaxID=1298593 RepID=M5DP25_9GAMM|nr:IS3 family transposase [Thalassolituus oleivorans]CCU71223.1 hypothetical protein TOL_0785 [Thalassolituus oleivorans MIL-1]